MKTSLVIFTHRYKTGPMQESVLNGVRLSEELVKYLGVILDKNNLETAPRFILDAGKSAPFGCVEEPLARHGACGQRESTGSTL